MTTNKKKTREGVQRFWRDGTLWSTAFERRASPYVLHDEVWCFALTACKGPSRRTFKIGNVRRWINETKRREQ